MDTSLITLSTLYLLYCCTIQCVTSQSTYTAFIDTVCDTSYQNYSECACHIANFTVYQNNNLECFASHNCRYDVSTNSFCSGNGKCDFISGICLCDTDYGSDDCSQKFKQYLPSQLFLLPMMALAALLCIICVALNVWVHAYRAIGDVRAMSVVFTHFTLVGCALICCGTFAMAFGFNNANCVILEWFHFLGICIVISCALLKSYRIASIFGEATFSPSDLTDAVLLKYFGFIMVVNVFFLSVYTTFNFLEGGAYDRYISDTLYKETRCSSKPLTIFSYSLLVAWQLILLLFVIKYGNESRKASDIFKETKCIYVGSNIGSMFFIAFGILILFTTHYTLQIVIRGYGTLVVVVMVIGLLFTPKFRAVYDLNLLERRKSMEQGGTYVDEDGNTIDKETADLKRQYEAHVKEPNGKELLLLLDALVKEIAYRAKMKMLSIELDSVDLLKVTDLMKDIMEMIPDEFPIEVAECRMQQEDIENNEESNDQITRDETEVP